MEMFARTVRPATATARSAALTRSASQLPRAIRNLTTSAFKRPCLANLCATSTSSLLLPSSTVAASGETSETFGLALKVSAHPALASVQVRYAQRNTTFNMTHFKRKRRLGFLARKRSRTGRAILMRRQLKKRTGLTH